MKFAIVPLPHTFPLRADPAEVEAALHWASEDTHRDLLARLDAEYDGFAVAMRPGPDGPEHRLWLDTPDVRFLTWTHRHFARGGKQRKAVEVIAVRSTRAPLYSPAVDRVTRDLVRPGETSKPGAWLPWVLAHLGAIPGTDTVTDLFTGQPLLAFDNMLPLEAIA